MPKIAKLRNPFWPWHAAWGFPYLIKPTKRRITKSERDEEKLNRDRFNSQTCKIETYHRTHHAQLQKRQISINQESVITFYQGVCVCVCVCVAGVWDGKRTRIDQCNPKAQCKYTYTQVEEKDNFTSLQINKQQTKNRRAEKDIWRFEITMQDAFACSAI